MTVPDDGWHEVPGMVMLRVQMPISHLTLTEPAGSLPDAERQAAGHKRKERR
jgi:hypothetical protein